MKILLSGFNGHMGKEVAALCAAGYRGAELAVGVDIVPTEAAVPVYTDFNAIKEKADVIVDFSHHSAIVPLLAYAKRTKTPVVVATTGQNEAELAAITEAAKSGFNSLLYITIVITINLGVFNLLPIQRLDGGVILSDLLISRLGPIRGSQICEKVSLVCTVFLWMCAAAVQIRCGGNLSVFLISVYLLTKITEK